jgi:hypothetical protein
MLSYVWKVRFGCGRRLPQLTRPCIPSCRNAKNMLPHSAAGKKIQDYTQYR